MSPEIIPTVVIPNIVVLAASIIVVTAIVGVWNYSFKSPKYYTYLVHYTYKDDLVSSAKVVSVDCEVNDVFSYDKLTELVCLSACRPVTVININLIHKGYV